MNVVPLKTEHVQLFKCEMQEAFQYGYESECGKIEEPILPEDDIDESLNKSGSESYVMIEDGEIVGGAIIVLDEGTHCGNLDFLYVKVCKQGYGIGRGIWTSIEAMHPEIDVWRTCTPYFDKRNIHFYINVCGFYATEFFCGYHPDPNFPESKNDRVTGEGMFGFEKRMR